MTMNRCCQIVGNARIVPSENPEVLWRVVCLYCGLVIHQQRRDE